MKQSILKNKFLYVFCIALLIAVCACTFVFATNSATAEEAYTAAVWGGQDTDDLWYYGDGFLNVQGAKNIVSGWDKSALSKDNPVIIAVVDTGIDVKHELFDGVLTRDSNGNLLGYNAYTALSNSDATKFDIGDTVKKHGSSVAGIIAMLIKEFELQDYIKIYPIKANTASNDTFTIQAVTKAIDWASKNAGADVINLSLGLTESENTGSEKWSTDKNLQNAINEAVQSSIIVASAGNNGKDSKNDRDVFYPAGLNGVFSVMNYGKDGMLFSTSNYGSRYDLAAPGEQIYTSNGMLANASRYHSIDGTSAASPIVSFAAALLKLRSVAEGNAVSGTMLSRMMRNADFSTVEKGGYTVKKLSLETLLKQDFSNIEYKYKDPTDINLSYRNDNKEFDNPAFPNTVYMTAKTIKPVTYTASLEPYGDTDPDLDDAIEWYEVNTKNGKERLLGKGTQLVYTASGGGTFEVEARLEYGSDRFKAVSSVYVEYIPYVSGDVRVTYAEYADKDAQDVPGGGTVYTKQGATFALTGLDYLDPSVEIKWFVNGEQVYTGRQYHFVPSNKGEYTITAQYGGYAVIGGDYVFKATVKPFILRPLDLSMLIIGIVIILGAAVVCAVLYNKNKAKRRQDGDSPE